MSTLVGKQRVESQTEPPATGQPCFETLAHIPGFFWSIALQDDVAYLGLTSGEVELYDLSDPRQPQHLARYDVAAPGPVSLALDGDRILFAHRDSGLSILGIVERGFIEPLGHVAVPAERVLLSDTLAVISGPGGIQSFDIAEPADPRHQDRRLPGATDIALAGDRLAAAGGKGHGLRLYQVGDTGRWQDLGEASDRSSGTALALGDGLAYIAEVFTGRDWLATHAPRTPQARSAATTRGAPGLAGIQSTPPADESRIRIFDIGGPAALLVGSADLEGDRAQAMALLDRYLVVAASRLRLFDRSEPAALREAGSCIDGRPPDWRPSALVVGPDGLLLAASLEAGPAQGLQVLRLVRDAAPLPQGRAYLPRLIGR